MDSPTTETPSARPSVAQAIAEAAVSAVQQPGFIDALATQIGERVYQRLSDQQCAIPLAALAEGYVVVEPKKTTSGKVLILTQVPIQNSVNMCLVILAKDNQALEQPQVEGKELRPYTMVMYVDKVPGDLRKRTIFTFEPDEEELEDELGRQLRTLDLGSHAFFYMNIVQMPGAPE